MAGVVVGVSRHRSGQPDGGAEVELHRALHDPIDRARRQHHIALVSDDHRRPPNAGDGSGHQCVGARRVDVHHVVVTPELGERRAVAGHEHRTAQPTRHGQAQHTHSIHHFVSQ